MTWSQLINAAQQCASVLTKATADDSFHHRMISCSYYSMKHQKAASDVASRPSNSRRETDKSSRSSRVKSWTMTQTLIRTAAGGFSGELQSRSTILTFERITESQRRQRTQITHLSSSGRTAQTDRDRRSFKRRELALSQCSGVKKQSAQSGRRRSAAAGGDAFHIVGFPCPRAS